MQVFANDSLFTAVYPLRSKKQAGQAFSEFIHEFGAPAKLIMDNAGKQTGHDTDTMKNIRQHQVRHRQIKPQRYNHNKAEMAI